MADKTGAVMMLYRNEAVEAGQRVEGYFEESEMRFTCIYPSLWWLGRCGWWAPVPIWHRAIYWSRRIKRPTADMLSHADAGQ